MDPTIQVFIKIERCSNQKYEWNKTSASLELDRVLPYPYAYGFIPETLAQDGDALDILVVTDKKLLHLWTFKTPIFII